MKLSGYTDFIVKYTTEQPLERGFPFRIDDSTFVNVPEMLDSLYKDNLISYFRTQTTVLSINQFDERLLILDAIAESNYYNKSIVNLLTKIDINHMKEGLWIDDFNYNHSAITPTSCIKDMQYYFNPTRRPYDTLRKEIYLDICKSYISLFIPD